MDTWTEIRKWRNAKRAELVAERLSVPAERRRRVRSRIGGTLRQLGAQDEWACVGFYWPIRGEVDTRSLVRELATRGALAALPVVVEKERPVEFWRWRPGMAMQSGVWNIPVPGERHVLYPTVLMIPLLGFDQAGFRLGNGGGYYDRSLAAPKPKPLAIGIGYEVGRVPSIHPQPHDVPMDIIVTEAGIRWFGARHEPGEDPGQILAAARASPRSGTEQTTP